MYPVLMHQLLLTRFYPPPAGNSPESGCPAGDHLTPALIVDAAVHIQKQTTPRFLILITIQEICS